MKGYITARQEFLFPDTELGKMEDSIRVVSTANGKIGIQLLFRCRQEAGTVSLEGEGFEAEYYQLVDIPVEMNTGNGVDQGGAMVMLCDHCPDYAIRQAPFRVLDCLRPLADGNIPSHNGLAAAYVCLCPEEGITAGEHELTLTVCADGESHRCHVTYVVYPVRYDESRFHQTNWFSMDAIADMHGLTRWSPEHYDMIRLYARTMRRAHQDTFCFWFEDIVKVQRNPWHFDFSALKPLIPIFMEEGFTTLETGAILHRGFLPDGSANMYTNSFTCAAAPEIAVDSDEGYELLSCEMRDFAAFLREIGWDRKVLFHIMDEPDVHYKTEADLEARRVQYFMASNLVRRYVPRVQTIEAVKTTKFRGGVDILVPITDGYQKNKEAFDTAMSLGDAVWSYVCCGPEGKWLNRFLDQPLVNGRLLFWGFAKNRISGYLHWGYIQPTTANPFEATRGTNSTGIGTDFPCGDSFIVYPGTDGPWISMRLEAERRGAEEAALLCQLQDRDPAGADALAGRVFTAFDEYDNDPQKLEQVYEELLKKLS